MLTRRGDCVIAVKASKGALDLNEEFKEVARHADTTITVIIEVSELTTIAVGRGDPGLTFTNKGDLVARKSTFTCHRTFVVDSDKAAIDFSRAIIRRLKKSSQKVGITLIAES